jgi:UDP-3-O-[3-hydroxymyristoyl] glucosamine N-acyltransferase
MLATVRLGDIAALVGGDLLGDADLPIARIAPLETAGPDAIAFLANPRYAAQMRASLAGCVIVAQSEREAAAERGAALVCAEPYLAFARLTQWWAQRIRPERRAGVHPSAVVEEGAWLDPSACIEAMAFVARGAHVAAGAVVGSQACVGADARLGEGSWLKARAVLSEACRVGARAIVHSGAVIGADGFGFAPSAGQWVKIEQLGAVVIGDDVEIGANTCIDRGALDDTVLEDGVKLDNLVQIGHNVIIGAHTALAGCVGIAGSARLGRHCTAGGGAIVLGHLSIADHVHIGAATVVTRSIAKPGQYSGLYPFEENAAWEKNAATLRQLHALRLRLRTLEKTLSPSNRSEPDA